MKKFKSRSGKWFSYNIEKTRILTNFDIDSYTKMVGSALFVKSTPPRAFSILFRHVPHILKMCMKNYNTEKLIFDKFTAFFNIAIFDHCFYTMMVCEINSSWGF